METKIQKLIDVLGDKRVFIQTHNFPDPDAISSAYGLKTLLEIKGVPSTICYHGKMDKVSTARMVTNLEIEMSNILDIPDMTENDAIITIDAQKYNSNLLDLIGDEVACIDHHPTFIDYNYKYSDIRKTGACASIIAEYFIESNTPIPSKTATALIYGIKMDTSDLKREVSGFDIEMFGKLYEYADIPLLTKLQTNTMEFNDLRAYGAAIENIKVYDNVGIAYIPFNCPDALIAMVSDFILALDVIEFSIVYAKRPDGYKFSVRSEVEELDAGKITCDALFGVGNGGGHASFAGGFIPLESAEEFENLIDEEIKSMFTKEIAKYQKITY